MLLKFPRKIRLTERCDFQSVLASSNKILYKYLSVRYQLNQKKYPRLGIIIGKHVVNRATDRNHIKRLIRESFRRHQKSLKGLDIVVAMRSKCSPLPKASLNKKASLNLKYHQALRNDINNLWDQLTASLKTV